MRIILVGNGRVHVGSPEEIVEQMRSRAWGAPDDLEGYLRWAAGNAKKYAAVGLPTFEEADLVSCAAYVDAMIRVGYAVMG